MLKFLNNLKPKLLHNSKYNLQRQFCTNEINKSSLNEQPKFLAKNYPKKFRFRKYEARHEHFENQVFGNEHEGAWYRRILFHYMTFSYMTTNEATKHLNKFKAEYKHSTRWWWTISGFVCAALIWIAFYQAVDDRKWLRDPGESTISKTYSKIAYRIMFTKFASFLDDSFLLNWAEHEAKDVVRDSNSDLIRDDKIKVMKTWQVERFEKKKDKLLDFIYVGIPDEYELT